MNPQFSIIDLLNSNVDSLILESARILGVLIIGIFIFQLILLGIQLIHTWQNFTRYEEE